MALTKVRLGGFEPQYVGRRNLIINGAMQVAQRGTSLSLANSPSYIIDRFDIRAGIGSGHTASQVTDVPAGQGFLYSLKLTTGTAGSLIAGNGNNYCSYKMESNDSSSIGDGTVGSIVTLSFWVKSSLTGLFGLAFGKDTSVLYPTSYTISSANTWEKKTIIIPATTLTDFGDNGTSIGARIFWNWGAGSNFTTSTANTWAAQDNRGGYDDGSAIQLVENSSATWQITGVQLEVGSVATPFEHRSFGEELALCQRYYHILKRGVGDSSTPIMSGLDVGSQARGICPFPVSMRANPTVGYSALSDFAVYSSATNQAPTAIAGVGTNETRTMMRLTANFTAGTTGDGILMQINGSAGSAYIDFDAEL
jgi:hypothetical protein